IVAESGRLPDNRRHTPESVVRPPADHCTDGKGDEGRPREMPGGRRLRLSRQAGEYRAAPVGVAHVAPPVTTTMSENTNMTGHEKVNILLVDDQPAKLLS